MGLTFAILRAMRRSRLLCVLSLLVVLACTSDDDDTMPDAATGDAMNVQCSDDSDCSDGIFCNGEETCDPDSMDADDMGCVTGEDPCDGLMCREGAEDCVSVCPDDDGDGVEDIECGGTDCDDSDPNRYPGNTEVCDANNLDEDCDPRTFGFRDADMDGETDSLCCNEDGEDLNCGLDCDDMRPSVSTTAVEACDGLDNDCDMMIDEGVLSTFIIDEDGDGFGAEGGEMMMACNAPAGFTAMGGDCDDTRSGVNPGLGENCDPAPMGGTSLDENCNGEINEDCSCSAGQSRPCPLPGVCANGEQICDDGMFPETCTITPEPETAFACDGLDNDCDGTTDEGLTVVCYLDNDNDSYPDPTAGAEDSCPVPGREAVGGCPPGFTNRAPGGSDDDCDDTRSSVFPGAEEVCGGGMARDEDCDGSTDEGVSATCYVDGDNDTYAEEGSGSQECTVSGREAVGGCPFGTTDRMPGTVGDDDTDCDDATFNVNPGASEVCDIAMVDEDCDGEANPTSLCACTDGSTRSCGEGGLPGICAVGIQNCSGGAWSSCSVMPEGDDETDCDGRDEDCDGATDEGLTVTCYADVDGDGYAASGASSTQACSCPVDTTTRAPDTAENTDCDDGEPTTHPGAAEQCDRIDSDCSNGGGAEPGEDNDNDGHTSNTNTTCTNGFPRDDCNDFDVRVYPGHSNYYRSPRCDGHSSPPMTCFGGGTRCVSCTSIFGYAPTNFDYDCDETAEPHPQVSCQETGNPIFNCENRCGGDGTTNPEADEDCGESVSWTDCGCDHLDMCVATTTRTSPLTCQ